MPIVRHKNMFRGFTLVEMIVVVSIVMLISTTMFFNYNRYGSKNALRNLAYRVALEIRTVQALGVGVRGYSSGGTLVFNAHGLWFDMATPTQIDHFIDLDNNRAYDAATERVEAILLGRGNSVSALCFNAGSGCTSPSPARFGVLFKRPDTDAYFVAPDGGAPNPAWQLAEVTVSDDSGATKKIVMYPTGQIDIQ